MTIISPAAQMPVTELVFSYLLYRDLSSCRVSCKRWQETIDSPQMDWLWIISYEALVSSKLQRQRKVGNVNWLSKCRDIFQIAQGKPDQFFIEDFAESMQLPSIQRLTCRAGHSSNLVSSGGRDFVLLFAGASHFFNFISSVEMISVDPKARDEDKTVVISDLGPYSPPARWLHAAATITGSDECLFYGGQAYGSIFSDAFIMKVSSKANAMVSNPSISCHRVDFIWDCSYDYNNAEVPGARAGHSLVYDHVKKSFVMFGGSLSTDSCSNECFVVKLLKQHEVAESSSVRRFASCNKIECTGKKPSARWCHSAVISGRNMLVFGGWSIITPNNGSLNNGRDVFYREDVFLNDVYALNMDTYHWTRYDTLGTAPSPRCQAAVFTVGSDDRRDSHSELCSVGYYESQLSVTNECVDELDIGAKNASAGSSDEANKGYLIVYGGAVHHEQPPTDRESAGILKLDLHDFKVLDLDTQQWLPVSYSFPRSRGGGNAVTQISPGCWLLSGGMHANSRASPPRFKNDLLLVIPNVGEGKRSFEMKVRPFAIDKSVDSDNCLVSLPIGTVDTNRKIFNAKV